MQDGLMDLVERHPSGGDVRVTGLLQVIELVRNRDTRQPMRGWNHLPSEAMRQVASILPEEGMNTFVKWVWISCAPPLIISRAQIEEGLAMLDKAAPAADNYCKH